MPPSANPPSHGNEAPSPPDQGTAPVPVEPRPPAFWRRTFRLMLFPEQWAEAARYRYAATFWPVFWLLIVTSVVVAVTTGQQLLQQCGAFAKSYDRLYQPMQLQRGTLTVLPAKGRQLLKLTSRGRELVVRPTVQTVARDTSRPQMVVLTKHDLILTGSATLPFVKNPLEVPLLTIQAVLAQANGAKIPSGPLRPAEVPAVRIDSTSLGNLVRYMTVPTLGAFAILGGAINALQQAIWAALMVVLGGPLVMILNTRLGMPLRVAYRIATAVLAPILALKCLLLALGIIPPESKSLVTIWLLSFSPLALAMWAGVLASRLYRPTPP